MKWWQIALMVFGAWHVVLGGFLWFVGRNAQRREAEAHERFERDYAQIVEDERRRRAAGGQGDGWIVDEWGDGQ